MKERERDHLYTGSLPNVFNSQVWLGQVKAKSQELFQISHWVVESQELGPAESWHSKWDVNITYNRLTCCTIALLTPH